MNKLLSFAFIASVFAGCGADVHDATEAWGTDEFTSEKWQNATAPERSGLVHSFLTKYDIDSLSAETVTAALGAPTAYYEYDEFPAYEVVVGDQRYVMAFPIDRETNLVRKLVFVPPL